MKTQTYTYVSIKIRYNMNVLVTTENILTHNLMTSVHIHVSHTYSYLSLKGSSFSTRDKIIKYFNYDRNSYLCRVDIWYCVANILVLGHSFCWHLDFQTIFLSVEFNIEKLSVYNNTIYSNNIITAINDRFWMCLNCKHRFCLRRTLSSS